MLIFICLIEMQTFVILIIHAKSDMQMNKKNIQEKEKDNKWNKFFKRKRLK
jgi:hypothetical protein